MELNYKTRKKIFFAFVFVFIIATALISLYAVGYKINLSWPLKPRTVIQKTGMLIFDTEPEKARIYLNGELQESFFSKYFSDNESELKTPVKIQGLLPGEYNVRLELDGYWPWIKNLEVFEGKSTFAEDIILFKDSLPLKITNLDKKSLSSQSPNKKYIAIYTNKNILIVSTSNDRILNTIKIESDIKEILWSADSEKIIAGNKIITIKDGYQVNINSNLSNIKWGDGHDEIYCGDGPINLLNANSLEKEKEILEENCADYLVNNKNTFIINTTDKTSVLKTFGKEKNLISEIELPYSTSYKLINTDHKLLNILDEKNKILYLVDPFFSFGPLKEIISNTTSARWVSDNKLLYSNNHEIWIFDLANHKKTILLRIGEKINGVIWHPSNNYIIYSTNKSINILELDEREKRNITEVIALENISTPYLNKNGESLYFSARIGQQNGLYKLLLK